MKKTILSVAMLSSVFVLTNCSKDDNIASKNLIGEWTHYSSSYDYKEYWDNELVEDESSYEVEQNPDKLRFNEDSTYSITRSTGSLRSSGTFSYLRGSNQLVFKRLGINLRDTFKVNELGATRLSITQKENDTWTSGGTNRRSTEEETMVYTR